MLDRRFVQLAPFIPEYDRDKFFKDIFTPMRDFAERCFVPETDPQPKPQASPAADPLDPEQAAQPTQATQAGQASQAPADGSSSSSNDAPIIEDAAAKRQRVLNTFYAYMSGMQPGGNPRPDAPPLQAGPRETTRAKFAKEWKNFLKTPQIDPKGDPLVWWRDNQKTYPVLSSVAKRLLAIPASSATRVFVPFPFHFPPCF